MPSKGSQFDNLKQLQPEQNIYRRVLAKVDQVEMKTVQGLDMILFQQVAHPPGAVLQKETQAGRVLLAAVGAHVGYLPPRLCHMDECIKTKVLWLLLPRRN